MIIERGSVTVEKDGDVINYLKEGDTFGEMALIYTTKRTASIRCEDGNASFFLVKAGIFRKTLKDLNMKNYFAIKELLHQVKAFSYLTNKEKSSLSRILIKTTYDKQ